MIEYEKLYDDVKNKLSKIRFNHSEGVVKRAVEYAKIYNINENLVKLVAITHDVAKELTTEQINYYIDKYNIKLDNIEMENKSLIHSKIGAKICEVEYNFTEDMVNAIKYHTTGRANMSMLEKIIYLADATEENRKYDMSKYIEIIKKDINLGMLEVAKLTINKLLESNKTIHLDSIECFNYYVKFKEE